MMQGLKRAMAAFCAVLVGVALMGQRRADAAETVRVNGSGIALVAMKPLMEAFRKSHPEVRFEMDRPMGSSGAIKAMLAGALDFVVSSKPLKPEEAAKGAIAREYGITPLALVTEKGVRKADITTGELENIYAGAVRTWPNGETIRVILRPEADIDTTILRGLSPGMNRAISTARSHPGMIVAVTDPESNSMVANTPGALGASGLASVILGPDKLNTLTLNGVKPAVKSLADGRYPLAKDIRFIVTGKTPPAALEFLDFARSPQGRVIAERAGVLVTAGGARK